MKTCLYSITKFSLVLPVHIPYIYFQINTVQIKTRIILMRSTYRALIRFIKCIKSKVIPRQAEVALAVPGRLRPRINMTFGTTRVVGRQSKAPAAFTPGEIPGTHFRGLSRPQGTWFYPKEPRKKSPVTPQGIDPGTAKLVAQRLNHYANV